MTSFVHLIEGDCAAERLARITRLARASRQPPVILAEAGDQACSPLDWLMGPGCSCCLPYSHPRLRLLRVTADHRVQRILIDAGPPAMADRIIAILRAMPVRMRLNVLAQGESAGAETLDSVSSASAGLDKAASRSNAAVTTTSREAALLDAASVAGKD